MILEGQRLGEFEILERLGEGGMGAVYKARQPSLDRLVALKTLNASLARDAGFIARFRQEAKVAAGLVHQNLVQVISAGKSEGWHWFAMEYVAGESARARLLREGRLEPPEALAITIYVARALEYGWRKAKLIHRDIKPENIFLSDDGEVKLGDLGLAKTLGQEGGATQTATSMGTPDYMAPEQVEDMRDVDLRADIYSLGCTLYHFLSGRPPFTGKNAFAVMAKHVNAPVPDLRAVWPECPAGLADAVAKMMRKKPAKRPQNYGEMIADLQLAYEVLSGATARSFTVEEKYRVIEPVGKTRLGHVFHAEDLTRQCEVRLFVLHEEMVRDSAACAALEQEVGRLKGLEHANLLRVLAFETFEDAAILATEWTKGFSLLELLRVRRKLGANEAILLLRQAAAGVDHAVEQGLSGLKFGLEQVLLDFAEPFDKETLLRQAVSQWPAWTLKIQPLGWNRDLSTFETWLGSRSTVRGGATGAPEETNAPGGQVCALATVIYELLGGAVSPGMRDGAGLAATRYTPLSALTEQGNEVLQRALDPATAFASAQELYEALARPGAARDGGEVRIIEPPRPSGVKTYPAQPGVTHGGSGSFPRVPKIEPKRVRTASVGRKDVFAVLALMVGGVALGATIAALVQNAPEKKGGENPGAPRSSASPTLANIAGSGSSVPVPPVGSDGRPPSATPAPFEATKDAPFVNTLGMKFVPVPGTPVLFSIWDTRVQDYAAYARVNKVDGEWATQEWRGGPVSRERTYPVVGVSWEDAKAFCQWLTEKESAEGKLPQGMSYRLPTDEEWSRAVGLANEIGATPAEKDGKNRVDFPWGKEFPPRGKVGNYANKGIHARYPQSEWIVGYDDGYATTSPVGSFPANAYGLYDMGGNVWQWCEDRYDKDRNDRVLRGAAWINGDRGHLLSSYRNQYPPDLRNNYYGFRCVIDGSAR